MEQSPLTLQSRPETFQPKVVEHYKALFADEDDFVDKPEGFWRELFLLKPDPSSLHHILDDLTADDLLHLQAHSHQIIIHAVDCIKASNAPSDEHALDTLTVYLAAVLSKRYTNPSSDIISVLAGLHDADAVISDLVGTLDSVIRNGRTLQLRQKAIRAALSVTSGAYQTGLISYFTHRDMFPALMKFVHDSEEPLQILEPFVLLGLLANYNKFEFQNPYRLRLDDFVNDATIKKIVLSVGATCRVARDRYISIQEDLPEGWTVSSTLNMIGLGVLARGSRPAAPVLSPEDMKQQFSKLPGPEAALLLSTYDFVNANKLFCFNLVTMAPASKAETSPFSDVLSLTSYTFQHAHRTGRAALYTHVCLYILRNLLEDQVLAKQICSEDSNNIVRLCRQRQPYLPLVHKERPYACAILDIMVDGINHNLRRRLDVEFYIQCIDVLLRIVSFLGRSRVRLAYHWSELWRGLLSFFKFLNTYATDIKPLYGSSVLVDRLINLVALSLSTGELFLPDPSSYDDLFYKLVETGDILTQFKATYDLSSKSASSSIDVLISVSSHYSELLESSQKNKTRSKSLSTKEVHRVIKQGYETLSIQAREGLDSWERFREADYRTALKRAARITVEDAKGLVGSDDVLELR
ncbi:DUF1741-domain-containing protein [Aulographum hederae CBS 113979]|uniref:DUF1741-domain-containing protein n=1 Tax=Aulographum hederae CBS 113979 TaxID=1176131 RepID=A0A6G1HET0_9PEZI|nr:DUF1741-domain-containing protein [Aulographum hederae CBS 113979]